MRGPYKDSEDRFDDLQILGEGIGRKTPINKVRHKSMVDGRGVNTAEEEVSSFSSLSWMLASIIFIIFLLRSLALEDSETADKNLLSKFEDQAG